MKTFEKHFSHLKKLRHDGLHQRERVCVCNQFAFCVCRGQAGVRFSVNFSPDIGLQMVAHSDEEVPGGEAS